MIPSPQELKRLQEKSGLNKADLAEKLDMSVAAWDNLISVNCKRSLPTVKFNFLLLLADEHPDYILKKRV